MFNRIITALSLVVLASAPIMAKTRIVECQTVAPVPCTSTLEHVGVRGVVRFNCFGKKSDGLTDDVLKPNFVIESGCGFQILGANVCSTALEQAPFTSQILFPCLCPDPYGDILLPFSYSVNLKIGFCAPLCTIPAIVFANQSQFTEAAFGTCSTVTIPGLGVVPYPLGLVLTTSGNLAFVIQTLQPTLRIVSTCDFDFGTSFLIYAANKADADDAFSRILTGNNAVDENGNFAHPARTHFIALVEKDPCIPGCCNCTNNACSPNFCPPAACKTK